MSTAAATRSPTPSDPPPPHKFGWHRVTRTLMVIGVALVCAGALYLFGRRLPAFASISRSAMVVVGVIALAYVIRAWYPRRAQRRHGERRHVTDRRE